jgi:hypothetical protein
VNGERCSGNGRPLWIGGESSASHAALAGFSLTFRVDRVIFSIGFGALATVLSARIKALILFLKPY